MHNFQTPLCELAWKYGSDKCPQINNPYTPFYYELLKDYQQSFKKVLEVGVGGQRMVRVMKQHGIVNYRPGASIYMWRDFFPNAHIYGGDIDPISIFTDDRITTYYCDETKQEDLEELIKRTGPDIDLFIDDALHSYRPQVNMALTVLPLLQDNVIYIIEDVISSRRLIRSLSSKYNCQLVELYKFNGSVGHIIIVRKHV